MKTTIHRPGQHYRQHGYYIHDENLFPPPLLERAIAGLEAVRDGEYDAGTAPDPSPWQPGGDPRQLVKIENPQLASHALRELLQWPALGELAAAVTGARRVRVWWVQGLIKPTSDADAAPKVGWHQDRQYWDGWTEDSELLTAWVALSDVTSDAGPMKFVPGSHAWGLLGRGDFFGQSLEAQRDAIEPPAGAEWCEVEAVLPPGGASFHHQLTFHGSGPNTSGRPRRGLAVHLCTERAELIAPDAWVGRHLDDTAACPVIYEA